MDKVQKNKNLKHCTFKFRNGDRSKKAGVNFLEIQRSSKDSMIGAPSIRLSITEAKALSNFLNESLSQEQRPPISWYKDDMSFVLVPFIL